MIGEPQILGQITRALELARSKARLGPPESTLPGGNPCREACPHRDGHQSQSRVCVARWRHPAGHIKKASVVVLGAGEMAELTVEALRKRGVERIRVVNRTQERAHALAERWGAEAAAFESPRITSRGGHINLLHRCAASGPLCADGGRRHAEPPGARLVLIDIAVPRDIDPDAASISSRQAFRHRWTQRSARRFTRSPHGRNPARKAHPGTGAF